MGKKDKLHSFEQVKNFHLTAKPFQDWGVLTNTFKTKRNVARKTFGKLID